MKRVLFNSRYLLLLLAFTPLLWWTVSNGQEQETQPLLSLGSHMDYLFAAISAALFLTAALWLFKRVRVRLPLLLATGAFTGTIGVLLLLAVQSIAVEATHERWSGSRNFIFINYVLRAIAYSYHASSDSSGTIEFQVVAYVCGVGLCEELVKLLPVLWLLRRRPQLAIADSVLVGFVSGVGFGIAEGIHYSELYYNGRDSATIYVVRFLSLVAMHGVATATAGALAVRHDLPLTAQWSYFGRLIWVISPVMLLHGLYDTFCDRGATGWALLVVFLLFGVFAYQIESSRAKA
jgi:RsiW-degrading membrane proteinase PrsW (M82 family)